MGAFIIGAIYVGRRTYKYVKKNNIKMPWEKKAEKAEAFWFGKNIEKMICFIGEE